MKILRTKSFSDPDKKKKKGDERERRKEK